MAPDYIKGIYFIHLVRKLTLHITIHPYGVKGKSGGRNGATDNAPRWGEGNIREVAMGLPTIHSAGVRGTSGGDNEATNNTPRWGEEWLNVNRAIARKKR